MNIAIIAPLAPEARCGECTPHETVRVLVAGLGAAGHEVTWFGAGATCLVRAPGESVYASPEEVQAPKAVEVWETLHLSRCFERAQDFDIIHNHAGALALAFAHFIHTPLVSTLAGTPMHDILPAYRAYQKHSYYISVADGARSPELDYVATVHPGVDLEAYPFSAKGGEALVVLDLIRDDPGLNEALEATAVSGRPLLLGGPVADPEYLRSRVLTRLGEGRIRVVEAGTRRARTELLGQAFALLCLDSEGPTVSLGALEAMACGTPVLVSPQGALPELVAEGRSGLVVDSAREAASSLERLEQFDRQGCRDWVEAHFSASHMVEASLKAYEDVLSRERPRSRQAQPPWGRWEVLLDESDYKLKRISVEPGKRLSYQKHARRAEHWTVVQGRALVTLDGRDIPMGAGESIDIPTGAAHRIANPDDETVVFIEVQRGDYFGEDDIERLEDDYGRKGTTS